MSAVISALARLARSEHVDDAEEEITLEMVAEAKREHDAQAAKLRRVRAALYAYYRPEAHQIISAVEAALADVPAPVRVHERAKQLFKEGSFTKDAWNAEPGAAFGDNPAVVEASRSVFAERAATDLAAANARVAELETERSKELARWCSDIEEWSEEKRALKARVAELEANVAHWHDAERIRRACLLLQDQPAGFAMAALEVLRGS
jgi:hypothetical protein